MIKKVHNFFSWVISIVFHPLIYATLGSYVLFQLLPEFTFFHVETYAYYVGYILTYTYLYPLFFVPVVYAVFYLLGHKDIASKSFRISLLIITTAFYIFLYNFVFTQSIFFSINLYILLSSLLLCVSLIITLFWRISLHMIGIGGFIGLLFSLLLFVNVYNNYLFAFSVIVAGLVAHSRLVLKAHTHMQIYIGFITGFFITVLFYTAMYNM